MVAQQPPSLAPPAAVGNDVRKILWNILEYSKKIFCSNKILEDTNCHYPLLPLKRKLESMSKEQLYHRSLHASSEHLSEQRSPVEE